MSDDTPENKESRSQRAKGDQRKQRNEGALGWYDEAVDANYQEEEMQIPKEKVGLVIGTKGWTIKDVKERSGVQNLFVRNGLVHLRGTEEQRANAKKIIGMILRGEDSSWEKLDFIPEEYMGGIIGKNCKHLNDIEKKTGATLTIFERNNLCVKGSNESRRRAIQKIKENLNRLMNLQSVRCTHVDTTELDLKQEFHLMPIVQPPNACNPYESKRYKLQQLEETSKDVEDCLSGFTDIRRLKDDLLTVLKKINKENEEERVEVVIRCHLGHAYIGEINEDDEKEDYFTVEEIKEKLEDKKSWKPTFEGGLEDIESERIEDELKSHAHATNEDRRFYLTFYTPSHKDIRVKVWLVKKDPEQEGDETTSWTFSGSAPIRVNNVLTHAVSDDQCFYLCSQYQQRMKVDILMISKTFDYRLLLKTCQSYVPKTPTDEEEAKVLGSYLMGMKIEGDQLVLPPVSELPDGFDLFSQSRCLRRTYQYEMEGEQFSLTVCKDQRGTVDPVETYASNVDKTVIKTDIHLHCEEWNRLLDEGNWEPEQIVAKLPMFLKFLREVQRGVLLQK